MIHFLDFMEFMVRFEYELGFQPKYEKFGGPSKNYCRLQMLSYRTCLRFEDLDISGVRDC
jgi:hypothetical protein